MKIKRTTIYDIANKLGVAPSTVSKALNNQPSISKEVQGRVKAVAREFNYIHNATAANLRGGISRSIGIIVPKINTTFFSNVIAGIEESCSKHNYSPIICQTEELLSKEIAVINMLISKNVDCILISLSAETKTVGHLKEVCKNQIPLIQFDRINKSLHAHTVINNNQQASGQAVDHLIDSGFKKIAFLGGLDIPIYNERKKGYLKAVKHAGLMIPESFVLDNISDRETSFNVTSQLLRSKNRPDAFFAVSDFAALGVLDAAQRLGLNIPQDVGVVGFSNEAFSSLIKPGISSIDQQSKKMGSEAANIYFDHVLNGERTTDFINRTIDCKLIVRESSMRIPKMEFQ